MDCEGGAPMNGIGALSKETPESSSHVSPGREGVLTRCWTCGQPDHGLPASGAVRKKCWLIWPHGDGISVVANGLRHPVESRKGSRFTSSRPQSPPWPVLRKHRRDRRGTHLGVSGKSPETDVEPGDLRASSSPHGSCSFCHTATFSLSIPGA